MDPFTQRMLERARARQEKIDQKLANSGQSVPKRKPLAENVSKLQTPSSPVKSPNKIAKESVLSPKKSIKSDSPVKSARKSVSKVDTVLSPPRVRNDVMVTKKEFRGTKRGSTSRRDSDVSVEINIMHRNDIQIEVQVEERDAPMTIYDSTSDSGSAITIKEIEDTPKTTVKAIEMDKSDRPGLRHNIKSRLDRLGNLYSDNPNLSSPIHRTEMDFSSATPPSVHEVKEKPKPAADGKKKFGRLAALADEINNWEDDLTHHTHQPDPPKKTTTSAPHLREDKLDASTLDVSIHSINDINSVLQTTSKASQKSKPINSHTFTKPSTNECQRLNKKIVAELEDEGYRRISAGQSRLVYDFTSKLDNDRQKPNCASTRGSKQAAPKMAAMVANPPPIAKKPSIKKYKAPTPPRNIDCESDKDKENNVLQPEENDNVATECKQTKASTDEKPVSHGSPVVMRVAPKLNGNVDRNSVLSKAAMFEAGSPRAKDPAEMSLRERKALFEKNKGAAIVPKAPFGLAPSVKTLHGNTKADKPRPITTTPTKPTKSPREEDDNISHSSIGGIKGKLAALFNKEQTISETTIANKFKQEREKEMEMLQNRFNYKPKPEQPHNSDDEQSDHDPSEDAPLMGSTTSLALANKKPEIIANIPKVKNDHVNETENDKGGSQPVKRRSSQDSPVVLSVLEDVKRIKVNDKKEQTNGTVVQQPTSIYPHLSDIETDNSNTQDEYSDCGGSTENVNHNLNKSDNWAETSFGREVMNVVKKNNTSYKKAVRESESDNSGACDSELDDMLDEALDEHSDEHTTPKKGSLSSSSFVYQQQKQFKSPLKTQPSTPTTPALRDKSNELVHSVSFYRRMQSASSTPSTPLRIVRHSSPERAPPADASLHVTTVKNRIKELNAEIAKQQTVISQASQALNLCASTVEFSGSTEQAEGERLLLLATHRRQACVHEVQRLQVEGAGCAAAAGAAALLIRSVAVPLRRDYVRELNAGQSPNQNRSDKCFLTAHRRQACVHEVQRLQVEGAGCAAAAGAAALLIRSVAVPLRRDYVRELNAGQSPNQNRSDKCFLTAHRRQACVHEVQRLQVEGAGCAAAAGAAALLIRSVAVPLRRDYVRELNAGQSPNQNRSDKCFLTAHRRQACVHEVQRLQVEGAGCAAAAGAAALLIRSVAVPLRRDYVRELNAGESPNQNRSDKCFLTAHRRQACVHEVQRLQVEGAGCAAAAGAAALLIRSVAVPLRRDYVRELNAGESPNQNRSDKCFLTAHRRQACVHEVQRLQVEGAGCAAAAGAAALLIRSVAVPLRRDYVRELNAGESPNQNRSDKCFLTAHRGQACVHEVQRLQVEGAGCAAAAGAAALLIRSVAVPLRRDYVRELNAGESPNQNRSDKCFLTAHRRQACVHEVQRLQVEGAGCAAAAGAAALLIRSVAVPLRRDYVRELNAGESPNQNRSDKCFLTAHRRQACVHEVQRLQVEGAGCAAAAGAAALLIRSVAVPLRRDYVRELNADGAVGHHALCLLKCRDRVLATSMQLTQPDSTQLYFPDEIRMDGLASDFKVTVEVYLLQASKELLPHEVKYHIFSKKSSSKLLTPKCKVSELKAPRVQSPGGPLSARSPQFALHGYCIFALQQASRKTFTLNKLACNSPLAGSLSLDVRARLRVAAPAPRASFLTAFDDVSGLGAWHRRWFALQAPRLYFWKYPDDVQKKLPIGDIDLATVTSDKAVRAPRDLCARPHTILLESAVPRGLVVPDSGSLVYTKLADGTVVRRHLLAADTPQDRDMWLESLNKALEYVRCCTNDDE